MVSRRFSQVIYVRQEMPMPHFG